MGFHRVWIAVVLVVMLGIITGCGRDSLMLCYADYDCATGYACMQGLCEQTNPDDDIPDEIGNNSSQNANLPENNASDNSVIPTPPTECTIVDECDFGGQCFEDDFGACIRSRCIVDNTMDNAGQCATESCEIKCGLDELAQGCGCGPRPCSESSQCMLYQCIAGQCAACTSDDECGEGALCLPSGQCVEQRSECTSDDECPLDYRCSEREICVPLIGQCENDNECPAGRPLCVDNHCEPLPECVDGDCEVDSCRDNAGCPPGQLCDNGTCIQPSLATRCVIATAGGSIAEGQNVALEGFAYDQDDNGIAATFFWRSSNPDVAFVNIAQSHLVGGGFAGDTTVSARLNTNPPVDCENAIEFINLGRIETSTTRVTVFHSESQSPISGADVVLSDGSREQTNAQGVALFERDFDSSYDISIFSNDFNFITLQGIDSNDIRVPLSPRRGAGPVAGFTGQFNTSSLSTTGDFTIGLAGASIGGGLLEMDLDRLLGETFMTEFGLPGLGGGDIPLPGGVIGYGNAFGLPIDLKRTYYSNTAGGARIAWGLAGRVAVMDLISLMDGGGDLQQVLGVILPLFNAFEHAARPLMLTEFARVQDSNDINGNGETTDLVPDYQAFPQINMQPSIAQSLQTSIRANNFPNLDGAPSNTIILVGGTLLDASGYSPMGVSSLEDTNGDQVPDQRDLTMAPPHGSLVGGRYAIMALALPDNPGATLSQAFSAALWNGQGLPESITLGSFPDSSDIILNSGARTLSIQAHAGPLFRTRLMSQNRQWDIWTMSNGSANTNSDYSATISVPLPEANYADIFNVGATIVDAINTNIALNDLVKANGIGLRNAGLVTTSYNRTVLD